MRITKTHRAERDLEEIWLYIAEHNLSAADALIDEIIALCQMIAKHPMMGRNREELAPGLRSFPIGNYILFYTPMQDAIEVARVLHSARDIPELFTIQ